MEVSERFEGEVLIIEVQEQRVDARVAASVKKYLTDKFDEGIYSLVLDFKNVKFIDSSGLGALVTALKQLGHRGSMVLSGVDDSVMEVFKLTRMDRIFKVFSNEEEAVNALATV